METVLSLTLKDGQNPCQESAISLRCVKFYSGDNYGLGWGESLITSHEHGSRARNRFILYPLDLDDDARWEVNQLYPLTRKWQLAPIRQKMME